MGLRPGVQERGEERSGGKERMGKTKTNGNILK